MKDAERRRINGLARQFERDQPEGAAEVMRHFNELDQAFAPMGGKDAIATLATDILYRRIHERLPEIAREALSDRIETAVELMNPPTSMILTVVEQIADLKNDPLVELDSFIEYCQGSRHMHN